MNDQKSTTLGCRRLLITLIGAATLIAADARAATIIGVFSGPVTAGNDLNSPVGGQTTFTDNSATAVITGSGTSTLTWGTNPDGAPQSTGNFSALTFSGAANLPTAATSPIPIGTISFYNGTSATDTIIFGATLNLYYGTVSPATLLGTDTVAINSTQNQYTGTNLTTAQLQTDADYINICGNSSNVCQSSIESYESTEIPNYQPFLVDLYAIYQSDPSITLTSVVADPSKPGNGLIGSEPATSIPVPASVPEPASLVLLGGAMATLALARRRVR